MTGLEKVKYCVNNGAFDALLNSFLHDLDTIEPQLKQNRIDEQLFVHMMQVRRIYHSFGSLIYSCFFSDFIRYYHDPRKDKIEKNKDKILVQSFLLLKTIVLSENLDIERVNKIYSQSEQVYAQRFVELQKILSYQLFTKANTMWFQANSLLVPKSIQDDSKQVLLSLIDKIAQETYQKLIANITNYISKGVPFSEFEFNVDDIIDEYKLHFCKQDNAYGQEDKQINIPSLSLEENTILFEKKLEKYTTKWKLYLAIKSSLNFDFISRKSNIIQRSTMYNYIDGDGNECYLILFVTTNSDSKIEEHVFNHEVGHAIEDYNSRISGKIPLTFGFDKRKIAMESMAMEYEKLAQSWTPRYSANLTRNEYIAFVFLYNITTKLRSNEDLTLQDFYNTYSKIVISLDPNIIDDSLVKYGWVFILKELDFNKLNTSMIYDIARFNGLKKKQIF